MPLPTSTRALAGVVPRSVKATRVRPWKSAAPAVRAPPRALRPAPGAWPPPRWERCPPATAAPAPAPGPGPGPRQGAARAAPAGAWAPVGAACLPGVSAVSAVLGAWGRGPPRSAEAARAAGARRGAGSARPADRPRPPLPVSAPHRTTAKAGWRRAPRGGAAASWRRAGCSWLHGAGGQADLGGTAQSHGVDGAHQLLQVDVLAARNGDGQVGGVTLLDQ